MGLMVRSSNPGWDKRFLPQKLPDWLWWPLSLLFNRYAGSFMGTEVDWAWSWPLTSI